jgi:hypothetical protein
VVDVREQEPDQTDGSESLVWPKSGCASTTGWPVSRSAFARERDSAKLPQRSRARPAKHRLDQHLPPCGCAICSPVRATANLVKMSTRRAKPDIWCVAVVMHKSVVLSLRPRQRKGARLSCSRCQHSRPPSRARDRHAALLPFARPCSSIQRRMSSARQASRARTASPAPERTWIAPDATRSTWKPERATAPDAGAQDPCRASRRGSWLPHRTRLRAKVSQRRRCFVRCSAWADRSAGGMTSSLQQRRLTAGSLLTGTRKLQASAGATPAGGSCVRALTPGLRK